jgi:hypothetical protein
VDGYAAQGKSAYHMNKVHWNTVAVGGVSASLSAECLLKILEYKTQVLLDESANAWRIQIFCQPVFFDIKV